MEGASSQVPLTFDEVMVQFSEDEWNSLELWQRTLYMEVSKENYDMLVSLGYPIVKPPILLQSEEEKETSVDHPPGVRSISHPVNALPARMQIEEKEETANNIPVASITYTAQCTDQESQNGCPEIVTRNASPALHLSDPVANPSIPKQNEVEEAPLNNQNTSIRSTCFPIDEPSILLQCEEEDEQPDGAHLPGVSNTCNPPPTLIKSEQEEQPVSDHLPMVSSTCYPIGKLLVLMQSEEEEVQPVSDLLPGASNAGYQMVKTPVLIKHEEEEHPITESLPAVRSTSDLLIRHSTLLHVVKQEPEEVALESGGENILRLLVSGELQCKVETDEFEVSSNLPGELIQGEKDFVRLPNFREHWENLAAGRPCFCFDCTRSFKEEKLLKPAPTSRRGRKKGQRIKSEDTLDPTYHPTKYQQILMGVKPHACSKCGKRFNQKGNLHVHQKIHTGEKPFVCSDCGRAFSQKINLATHQRSHLGLKPFACTECGKHFTCEQSVRMHQKIHTGEKSYFCPHCGKGFIQNGNLRTHLRIHTGERPHVCSECGKSFTQKGTLVTHQKSHTRQRSFSCRLCELRFDDKAKLIEHNKIHGNGSPFTCHWCWRKFNLKGNLKKHLSIHARQGLYTDPAMNGDSKDVLRFIVEGGFLIKQEKEQGVDAGIMLNDPYQGENYLIQLARFAEHQANPLIGSPCTCSECETFLKIERIPKPQHIIRRGRPRTRIKFENLFDPMYPSRKYQRMLKGEKPYECDQCGKRFNQKGNLTVHQKTHLPEKPFKCSECGRGFCQKISLVTHQRTHLGLKPYACTECGKHFTCEQSVRIHHKIHTGEKSHFCLHCGKGFIQKGNLLTHQRIHTGEKPYTCTECGKSFAQRGTLKAHHRSHTRERLFSCGVCDKRFGDRAKLKMHSRIHGSDSLFICHRCGRKFTQKGNLKAHLKIHSGEKPHKCSQCWKSFRQRQHLLKHELLHGGGKKIISRGRKPATAKET
ncbi:zinc finger protein 271-like [Ambystoma mexicanum]|uniref:zinc finger protein 271-like n=1 Tax=Ambystoma mexicanum TaxID=8296 RepID=UPI0037E7DDA0